MRKIAARETQTTSFMTTDYVLDEAIADLSSSWSGTAKLCQFPSGPASMTGVFRG